MDWMYNFKRGTQSVFGGDKADRRLELGASVKLTQIEIANVCENVQIFFIETLVVRKCARKQRMFV